MHVKNQFNCTFFDKFKNSPASGLSDSLQIRITYRFPSNQVSLHGLKSESSRLIMEANHYTVPMNIGCLVDYVGIYYKEHLGKLTIAPQVKPALAYVR